MVARPSASIEPTPATSWSDEHLRGMLLRDRRPIPRLYLKGQVDDKGRPSGDTHLVEIACVYSEDGKLVVRKKYRGLHVGRGRYESQILELMRGWHVARGSVVSATQIRHGERESEFEMPWQGLSLWDWIRLLGADFPPFASVQAMLGLIRAILVKIQPLHEAGFVHGDLLYHNIIVDYGQLGFDHPEHWYLDFTTLRFIDFEFALAPRSFLKNNSKVASLHRLWPRDSHNKLIWLDDRSHSANLLPGTVRWHAAGYELQELPEAQLQDRIERIHWGADLCTIGMWLEGWLTHKENAPYRYDPLDFDEWDQADAWLRNLPSRLRGFDSLARIDGGVPEVPRCPHSDLVQEISKLIGDDERRPLAFRLSAHQRTPSPATAAPTLLVQAPRVERLPQFHPRRDCTEEWAPELAIVQGPQTGEFLAISADPIRLDQFLALTRGQDLRAKELWSSATRKVDFAPRSPVAGLSRHLCERWIDALNDRLRELCGSAWPPYRLLTRAEWTHACSCATGVAFTIGNQTLQALTAADAIFRFSHLGGFRQLDDPAGPQPVDDTRNKRNGWGLRGMHGNVREIVTGDANETAKTFLMGGSYVSAAKQLHLNHMNVAKHDQHEADAGFRVVRRATLEDIRAQFRTLTGEIQ